MPILALFSEKLGAKIGERAAKVCVKTAQLEKNATMVHGWYTMHGIPLSIFETPQVVYLFEFICTISTKTLKS